MYVATSLFLFLVTVHASCWPVPDAHLVTPKIFILLANTEALKPQKLDIFHELFEAWSSGLGVSSFLLSHRREKEEDEIKSCNAAKAAQLQHLGP